MSTKARSQSKCKLGTKPEKHRHKFSFPTTLFKGYDQITFRGPHPVSLASPVYVNTVQTSFPVNGNPFFLAGSQHSFVLGLDFWFTGVVGYLDGLSPESTRDQIGRICRDPLRAWRLLWIMMGYTCFKSRGAFLVFATVPQRFT